MDEKDFKTFLKAKKEQSRVGVLSFLSILPLFALVYLESTSVAHKYTIVLAVYSVILSASAMGSGRWVTVSRKKLIAIIQRQIDRDPEALIQLAKIKG